MKKIIIIMFCMVISFSAISCEKEYNVDDGQLNTDNEYEIESPIVECSTVQEAQEIVGFEIHLPNNISNFNIETVNVYDDSMIDIIYKNENQEEIRVRKAKGSDDISGDYTVYNQEGTIVVGNIDFYIKGNDGNINLITWTNNGYTHAISLDKQILKTNDIANFVEGLN